MNNIAVRVEVTVYIIECASDWLWYTLTRPNYYFFVNKMEQLDAYLNKLPADSIKKWRECLQAMKSKM